MPASARPGAGAGLLGDAAASRSRTQMKMLRGVQNERFTFEIDAENALVGSTLER